jgi:creatinine amidohydrolase/Fe(II)-dependent formamide hydrolase-like protein
MSWAASAREGEVDFDPEPLGLYAREVFRSLVRMGFRRIYVLQHHQGPDGLQSLCLRRAAAEVIRELTSAWGPEWGRRDPRMLPNADIFSLIRVAYLDSFSKYAPGQEQIPIGHGGKGETQLIMAAHPETVAMDRLGPEGTRPEWLRDAQLGRAEEGRRWIEFCVRGWVAELERLRPA